MVGKVEAPIDPDALLRNLNIVLRGHGPVSLSGNPLSLVGLLDSGRLLSLLCYTARRKRTYFCALSALHGSDDVGLRGVSVLGTGDEWMNEDLVIIRWRRQLLRDSVPRQQNMSCETLITGLGDGGRG